MKKVLLGLGIVATVFVVCVALISGSGDNDEGKTVEEISTQITLAKYNQIKTGMSYEQVVEIIGFDGVEQSRNQIMDITTVMYDWRNDNRISGMNAIFQNKKLTQKSQFALK